MKLASEADRLNQAETKGNPLGSLRGGKPVRKRGYHRALKRGEAWALIDQAINYMTKRMAEELYAPMIMDYLNVPGLSSLLGTKNV